MKKMRCTQNNIARYFSVCALFVVVILSCKKNSSAPKENIDGYCYEPEQLIFSIANTNCSEKNTVESLSLFGFFNDTSNDISLDNKNHFLETLNNNQTVICAPGPFNPAEKQMPIEKWTLNTQPAYFVLQPVDVAWSDENFCLTKEDGTPLPSEVIKIQKDSKA